MMEISSSVLKWLDRWLRVGRSVSVERRRKWAGPGDDPRVSELGKETEEEKEVVYVVDSTLILQERKMVVGRLYTIEWDGELVGFEKNPDETISMYEITELVRYALEK